MQRKPDGRCWKPHKRVESAYGPIGLKDRAARAGNSMETDRHRRWPDVYVPGNAPVEVLESASQRFVFGQFES